MTTARPLPGAEGTRPAPVLLNHAVLLDAYAARSCPVKTQNAFDPRRSLVPGPVDEAPVDEALQDLFDGGVAFETEVLDRLVAVCPGVVDLRELAEEPWAVRVGACAEAMAAGAVAIVAGAVPADPAGHRRGLADLWVRGADQADGRAGYHPVEVKWHKVRERNRTAPPLPVSALSAPRPGQAAQHAGERFRYGTREGDLLQVAHYWRLLQAAGWAARGPAYGGVIGTDTLDGDPVITWVDLDRPVIRTFSRTAESGYALRSVTERYDHEHAFRVLVAQDAARQGGPDAPPLRVEPIVIDECKRCAWFEQCRSRLDDEDLSLRIEKGPLDVREISVLRRQGVSTITDLARVDLEAFLPGYLVEVRHRPTAEARLRAARRKAELMVAGVELARTGTGPIAVPRASCEVDFDVETSRDGRIYLWGFLVHRPGRPVAYVDFTDFDDLDAEAELALARRALGWLRGLADELTGPDGRAEVRVYHYSGYERHQLERLAVEHDDPLVSWALAVWDDLACDLYELVHDNFLGAHGLGLKQVAAAGASFTWRDDDPGGLNSQAWFAEAVHGEPGVREAARRRLLEYNEDDVRATAAVRRWLRTLG